MTTDSKNEKKDSLSNTEDRRHVTKQELQYIARLAYLEIPQDREEALMNDMENMIHFADALRSLNMEGTRVTEQIVPMKNVLREDVVLPSMLRDAVLSNAPQQENGAIVVPNVLA